MLKNRNHLESSICICEDPTALKQGNKKKCGGIFINNSKF